MFWLIYNTLLVVGFPVIIGLLLMKKRCQRGILSRLGKVPNELQVLSGPVVWVHAASLGEVSAMVPLIRAMKEKDPARTFVVSTVTETGREMVLNRLKGIAMHCYAPVDFWWAVARYVRALNPCLYIVIESEIWPNLLTCLHQRKVPVCLVNGRISSRSFGRYRRVKFFMKSIWSLLDLALMQTQHDAERIKTLGARTNVVHATGNMKFDQSFEQFKNADVAPSIRTTLGISHDELVIVAGSTHPQEEEYLLRAYQALCQSYGDTVLVLAPRHIERASELEQTIVKSGLRCVRRSRMGDDDIPSTKHQSSRVILLDSRGELPYVYSVGVFGFVGGTFVPIGGHNLLEPAQWARPVLFGPHVDHCRDIAWQLLEAGGAIQMHEPEMVVSHFLHLIENPVEADVMGKKALSVIQHNRGVVRENLQRICQLIPHVTPPDSDSPSSAIHSSLPPHPKENEYVSTPTIFS